MGKTHEALERAEKEYQASLPKASHEPDTAPGTKAPQQAFDQMDMERYQDLKVNLLTRYPDTPIKTILFTATTHWGRGFDDCDKLCHNIGHRVSPQGASCGC
jgi:hypothetical protein